MRINKKVAEHYALRLLVSTNLYGNEVNMTAWLQYLTRRSYLYHLRGRTNVQF